MRPAHLRLRRRLHPLRRDARQAVQNLEERMTAPLSILMYHQIASPPSGIWHLAVTPKHFTEHVSTLSDLGDIVSLRHELGQRSTHRPEHKRRRFALTFDDGYADNLLVALPILEALDSPATFFISTWFLDRPSFWWDRWSEIVFDDDLDVSLIQQAWRDVRDPDRREARFTDEVPVDRGRLHRMAVAELVTEHPARNEEVLDQVCTRLSTHPHHGTARPLTTDELYEFAQHPLVDIGGHTVAHRRLTQLDESDCLAEIANGRRDLDTLLGSQQRIFAYPFGTVNRRVASLVRVGGFAHGLTIVPRSVSVFDQQLRLPRLDPQDIDVETFEALVR